MPVFPGTYKILLAMGKESDSVWVIVKPDPRFETRQDIYDAKKNMLERLQKSADALTAAMDRVLDAEETLTKLEAQLKGVEGKEADSLSKGIKAQRDEIKKLREPIFGRSSDKQGISRFADRTTTSVLMGVRMEIMGKLAAPTAQTERLLQEAEVQVQASVRSINDYMTGGWAAFRKQAEATPMKLFKA